MTRKTFFAVVIFFFCSIHVFTQTLVSTEPTLKTVVLENFTGINCPNCPSGHSIAESIRAANPDRVIIVGVHTGSYAVPSTGQPDFRTSFGTALANQSALTGYPAGTVNRHVFTNYAMNGGTAMSRSYWTAASEQILAMSSPVNVGVRSTFNTSTRLLTVEVELYYTSNPATTNNYINVALLESNVIGYQAGASSTYTHKNILRHFLTGQWGDTVNNVGYGAFRHKTYTYTVPSGYNISNCDVAAYVAQSHQEIMNGKRIAANGGTTQLLGSFNQNEYIELASPSVTTLIPMSLSSNLSGTETFNITLSTDAPNDWSASYSVNGNTYTGNGSGIFTINTPESIDFNVTPGNTPAVATYTLSFTSVSQPSLPVLTKKIIVISNVTDLVVNNGGLWGDGGTSTTALFQDNYIKGLAYSGETKYAVTPLSTFLRIGLAGKLNNIVGVYYNVGWSSPSFTDESVPVFSDYLDNGGNLLVSGQDVGWDNFDVANGGSGTANTQSFYNNYLCSNFVADGSTSNNVISVNSSDLIFGTATGSSITNVYGTGSSGAYMYPDQISPTSAGTSVFWYNNNTAKTAVVRSANSAFKTVNMGVSLEMISDTNARKEIISIAHDWFHGIITSDEFDGNIAASFGYCYPNPATDKVIIPVNVQKGNLKLELFDFTGKIVRNVIIPAGSVSFELNLDGLSNGLYYYRLSDENNLIISRPLSIDK